MKREDADRADFENTKDVHARADERSEHSVGPLGPRDPVVGREHNDDLACEAMRSGGEGPEARRCRVRVFTRRRLQLE